MPETLLLVELQVGRALRGEPMHQKDLRPQGAAPSSLGGEPIAWLTMASGLPSHASGPQLIEQQVGAVVINYGIDGDIGQVRIIKAQPLAVALAHVRNVVPC